MGGEILTGHRRRCGDGIGCDCVDPECARAGMAVVAMRRSSTAGVDDLRTSLWMNAGSR